MLMLTSVLLALCASFVTAAPIPVSRPANTPAPSATSTSQPNKDFKATVITPPTIEIWESSDPTIDESFILTDEDIDALQHFIYEQLEALAAKGESGKIYNIELAVDGDADESQFAELATLLLPEGFRVLKKTIDVEELNTTLPETAGLVRRAPPSLESLFPIEKSVARWSTSPAVDDNLPLSDETFRSRSDSSGGNKQYTTFEGRKVLKAHYPAGSFNPKNKPKGGFSFYAPGPASVDLSTAREAIFAYSVMFPKGFNFVKGGKLPGLYGGDNDDVAVGCSGGRRATDCFSARLMWRERGDGELYTYLPQPTNPGFEANAKICDRPNSDCNPTYGASVDRGSFKFTPGEWVTVSQHVRLNDPGKGNGFIQVYVNGEKTIDLQDVALRGSNQGRIRGMQMQTFFGGSSPEWATPEAQDVYFSDFSASVVETF